MPILLSYAQVIFPLTTKNEKMNQVRFADDEEGLYAQGDNKDKVVPVAEPAEWAH